MEKEEVKYTEIEKTTLFETDCLMFLRFDVKREKENSYLTTFLIVGSCNEFEFMAMAQKNSRGRNESPDDFTYNIEYSEEAEFYTNKIAERFGMVVFNPVSLEEYERIKSIDDVLYSDVNDEKNEVREVLRSLLKSAPKFGVWFETDILEREINMYDEFIEKEQKKVDRQMKTNVWLNNYIEEREELKRELKELKVNTFKNEFIY